MNPRAGEGNRCFGRNSEFHLVPECALRGRQGTGDVPFLLSPSAKYRPPPPSISPEDSAQMQRGNVEPSVKEAAPSVWPFSGSAAPLSSLSLRVYDSVGVLDTVATANLGFLKGVFLAILFRKEWVLPLRSPAVRAQDSHFVTALRETRDQRRTSPWG